MTEATQYREDVPLDTILHELMDGADSAVKVDCAGPRANFVQVGWFMFPKGSLTPAVEVTLAS